MNSNTIYNKEITNPQDDKKKFYVYVYIDPESKKPFYVGKGCKYRATSHLRNAKANKEGYNTFNTNKIKNILNKGMEPIIEFVKTSITAEEAYELEYKLVKKYGKRIDGTGCLTNITDGGEGAIGVIRDTTIYKFVHIDGTVVHRTQNQMHTQFNLSQACICNLIKGNSICHRGWFLNKIDDDARTSIVGFEYIFVNGHTLNSVTMTQTNFSKYIKCSASDVCRLVKGQTLSIKGWCLGSVPENFKHNISDPTIHKIVNIDGRMKTGTITELRKELNDNKIVSVIEGKRNHSHGWFLNEITEEKLKGFRINGSNPEILKFENVKTGEEFEGTRTCFYNHTGIDKRKISKMINNNRTLRSGWRLYSEK